MQDNLDDYKYLLWSTDFIYSLGGITTFAFIDKKGLLSWPNATIEKVFCFDSQQSSHSGFSLIFFHFVNHSLNFSKFHKQILFTSVNPICYS